MRIFLVKKYFSKGVKVKNVRDAIFFAKTKSSDSRKIENNEVHI